MVVGAHGAVRVETRDRRDVADPHSLDSPAKHPAKHHNAAIRRREMLVLAVGDRALADQRVVIAGLTLPLPIGTVGGLADKVHPVDAV